MLNVLKESYKRTRASVQNFYTPSGIHVYIKDLIDDDEIVPEKVVFNVEDQIPAHLLSEVEMIMIGWFDEFEERNINAFYSDGCLYVSNVQSNEEDMFDDIVHEIAHSLEEPYGYELYGDKKLENEFLSKRKRLHDILWSHGYKAPEAFFMDSEYDQEFDDFLLKKVGYGKLGSLMQGLFVNPYAATSLREYFATGFTEFYLEPDNHNFIKMVSPALYKKLISLERRKNT